MPIETLTQLLSSIADLVTVIAVIVGGAMSYYLLVVRREAAPDEEIDLEFTELPYNDRSRLLLITVRITNPGTKTLWPRKKQGITLSVRRLPTQTQEGSRVHFKDGTNLLENADVIKDANPDHDMEDFGYCLTPKSSYYELFPLVVPFSALLMAQAQFSSNHDSQVWVYKVWRTSDPPTPVNQTPNSTGQ